MQTGQYPPGHRLPGTVYRVVRHLATGGMGSVYDVEDTTVEKRYVLKTLHPNLVSREDLARRMRDEAKSLAKLSHPNIVDVITAGVTTDDPPMPFYVMERLIGQNLRVVLEKKGALDRSHAFRIAIDLADALEHAHEHSIVHRDVKPENIFLHRNPTGTTITKLLDFGIVRLLDRKASQTQGKFIGTLRYASPEQITGATVGPASDLYSLGLVLYEMLCGRGPFDDVGDAYAIGAAHASNTAPPLSQFTPTAGADIERLLVTTLSKDPATRPRDCFAFASELRRILRAERAAASSATVSNPLSSPPATPAPVEAASAATETSAAASSGATLQGMIAPSIPSLSPTRLEGAGVVSPVAATVAATDAPPRPPSGDPAHAPSGARGVDRNAPTRMSHPNVETRRLAPNDTQMVDPSALTDDAMHAGLAEAAPAPIPASAALAPSDLALEPIPARSGRGALAERARASRRAARRPLFMIGAAVSVAVVLSGGVLLAVKRPWTGDAASPPSVRGEARVDNSHGATAASARGEAYDEAHAPGPREGVREPEAPQVAAASPGEPLGGGADPYASEVAVDPAVAQGSVTARSGPEASIRVSTPSGVPPSGSSSSSKSARKLSPATAAAERPSARPSPTHASRTSVAKGPPPASGSAYVPPVAFDP